MKLFLKVLLITCFSFILFGLILYLCIYLIIWKPYFSDDWRHTECVMQNFTRYYFNSEVAVSGVAYTVFQTHVLVGEQWYTGFACGTLNNDLTAGSFTQGSNTFSYQYVGCADPSICGHLEMFPFWFCLRCFYCYSFVTAAPQPCLYSMSRGSSVSRVEDLPIGYNPGLPEVGGTYIQVVMGDQIYSPKEYVVLNAFAGILMGVPVLVLIGVGVGFGVRTVKTGLSNRV